MADPEQFARDAAAALSEQAGPEAIVVVLVGDGERVMCSTYGGTVPASVVIAAVRAMSEMTARLLAQMSSAFRKQED